MSYGLYRTLTQVLWVAALPYAAARRAAGSSEWAERSGFMPRVAPGSLWMHAASVGEVAAVSPLIRALAERGERVFLTVVTPTGREMAARSLPDVELAFAPLDFVVPVRRALASVRPSALLLVETELWPNTIRESAESGVPVLAVNARLSETSVRRYALPGSPLPGVLPHVSAVAARSEEDADRFRRLGVEPGRVVVAGDMKYDKLGNPPGPADRERLRRSLGFEGDARVLVIGSVRPREEAAVTGAVASLLARFGDLRVLVAPRHLERVPALASALDAAGVASVLRSALGDGVAEPARVVVLDSTGELSTLYAAGDVAFVGGTLADYGGHDPLEPAAHGVPVVLGPHTETCRESAGRLLSSGAAFEVADASELAAVVGRLLEDRAARDEAAARALAAVESGRGATGRTLLVLEDAGVIDA